MNVRKPGTDSIIHEGRHETFAVTIRLPSSGIPSWIWYLGWSFFLCSTSPSAIETRSRRGWSADQTFTEGRRHHVRHYATILVTGDELQRSHLIIRRHSVMWTSCCVVFAEKSRSDQRITTTIQGQHKRTCCCCCCNTPLASFLYSVTPPQQQQQVQKKVDDGTEGRSVSPETSEREHIVYRPSSRRYSEREKEKKPRTCCYQRPERLWPWPRQHRSCSALSPTVPQFCQVLLLERGFKHFYLLSAIAQQVAAGFIPINIL